MKRGKPLKRTPLRSRTSLKRSTVPIRSVEKTSRGTPTSASSTKGRAPLKQRSDKMARVYAEERVPLVVRLLAERPWCEACPVYAEADGKGTYVRRRSVDLHEVLSRGRGGSITDEANILCVCRPCHDRIGHSPKQAEALGLLKASGSP